MTAATTLTGASVAVNANSSFATGTAGRANASGVAYVKVTSVTANATIANKNAAGTVTISPAVSGGSDVLTVNQKAQPLKFAAATISDNVLTLATTLGTWSAATATTSIPTYTAAAAETDKIKIWRDGALLNIITSGTPTAAQVLVNWSAGTLTFDTTHKCGTQVKVYMEAGNVPAATAVFNGTSGVLIP